MATETPRRATLILSEPASTSATRIRIVIDDLINLILRAQLTPRAPMAALPTSLALLALRRINSFAFARASARRCARVFGGS